MKKRLRNGPQMEPKDTRGAKKRAQRYFKDDMQKNTYFRDANDPRTFKPGLAWKRKAPLVMSWNLTHQSSYQASGLGPRCARPRPRLCQQIWIPDFARIACSNLQWFDNNITWIKNEVTLREALSCTVEWQQCHTVPLSHPKLGEAEYRSAMEHGLISNDMKRTCILNKDENPCAWVIIRAECDSMDHMVETGHV